MSTLSNSDAATSASSSAKPQNLKASDKAPKETKTKEATQFLECSKREGNVEVNDADNPIECVPEGMIWDIRSDVFTDIFSWLNTKDKMTVSHVCRDFYDRITSDPDWPAQYEAAMLLPVVRKVFGALRQNKDNMQQIVQTLRRLRIRHAFQGLQQHRTNPAAAQHMARQHHRNGVLRTSFRALRLHAAGPRVSMTELERFIRTRERAVLRRVMNSISESATSREIRSVLRDFRRAGTHFTFLFFKVAQQ